MIKFKALLVLCLCCVSIQSLRAQQLMLENKWKYSTKDAPAYSSSAFDDTKWKVKSGNNLMLTKDDLSIDSKVVWLRTSVTIPSSFKKQLDHTGALAVFLGRIYQSDETYFNGELIGRTNSSDIKRAYLIDPKIIKWDKENIITIRIHHWGDKSGVDISPPFIGMAQPSALFEMAADATGVERKLSVKGKNAIYKCSVINRSSKAVYGYLNADFFDLSNKKLLSRRQPIVLQPGSSTFNFPYQSPSDFLKIHYSLVISEYAYTADWNDELGYQDVIYKITQPIVADKVVDHFTSPDLKDQVIKGWLGERLDANQEKRLFQVDEDAILAGYINRPGNHPWIGEHVGKFLDAASNTYKYSGNKALKIQLDRSAQKLIAAQLPNGYLGTYTPDNYWTSWDVWSHKYNIIGLLNYYSLSGYQPALNAAKKAGDLLCKTFGYNTGQLDIIKAGSHVGMAATSVLEPMVDLYRYTGDKKYLDFCYYIIKSYDQANGPKIIATLNATGGRVDKTANAKAYEMMSNLLGIIKFYKVTGDDQFLKPVLLAWHDIVAKRLYITGTASSFEHFQADEDLPATDKDNMGEGCVTTTWVQINYQLLSITGDMKYVNELERSVYNHLSGAENPETGCVSYYTSLNGIKPYRCVITCCMSSVPRGLSMIPLFTNGKIDGKPSFLFYQPGVYRTTSPNKVKVAFTTITGFPADGEVAIKVNIEKHVQMGVEFRNPYWAEGFTIQVNNEKQQIAGKETATINRVWKNDDKITIKFKMPLIIIDGAKNYDGQIALQRGPQILAFDKSLNGFDASKVIIDTKDIAINANTAMLPAQWVGGSAYQIKSKVDDIEKKIVLVPFADASQTGGVVNTWIRKEK